jgi:hypothetical protein
LSAYINDQNNRVWSAKNPHALHKNPLHLSTTGVWCAGTRRRIAGSLFEEKITAENYQNLVAQSTALHEENKRDCWLQQDGATARTANRTSFLQAFGDRITRREVLATRFSNFLPPDSILWVFLKERVYSNIQESWNILNIILNSALLALTMRFFEMWQETL